MAMLTGKVVARLPGIFLVSLIYCVPVYLLRGVVKIAT